MTLKNFLAELSFIQIADIKRHAKGLLIALEKSNRKEMLEYEVKWEAKTEIIELYNAEIYYKENYVILWNKQKGRIYYRNTWTGKETDLGYAYTLEEAKNFCQKRKNNSLIFRSKK